MHTNDTNLNSKNVARLTIYVISFLILSFGIIAVSKRSAIAPTASLLEHSELLKPQPREISMIAVGDILLTRSVGAQIDKTQDPNLPFANFREMLDGADITFGNLECPLDPGDMRTLEGLIFKCPVKYVPGLTNAGFDVLSTANNHTLDQGADNVDFTIDYLKSVGIRHVGTSASTTAPEGVTIERDGMKFGFLAYSYTARNDGGQSVHPQIATMDDIEKLKVQISNFKTKSDIVIISMHAGTEYTRKPNQEQVDFAHAAIDAGADIVIGHHPHWIQTIEIYKDKPIFYSLGNFVFDQMWSQDTREGLIIKLSIIDNQLQKAELVPVIIENFCCPRLATEIETKNILEKINASSTIMTFSKNN